MEVPSETVPEDDIVEFKWRSKPARTCQYLMAERNNYFKDLTIQELVSVGLFATLQDIKAQPKLKNHAVTKKLGQQALAAQKKNLHDFDQDYVLFCKALKEKDQLAAALIECAIHFSSKCPPESKDDWCQSIVDKLLAHDDPTSPDNAQDPASRVNTHDLTSRSTDVRVATLPNITIAMEVLGGTYLSMGVLQSHKRKQQTLRKEYTDAIQLSLPFTRADFLLTVWVSADVGRAVYHAMQGPFENLVFLSGSYLFEAMKKTDAWQEQAEREQKRVSEVLSLSRAENGKDYRLHIKICFDVGKELFKTWFHVPPENHQDTLDLHVL